MSTRDRLVSKASSFKGQKSAYPLESYGIDSGEVIQNFYLRNNQLNKVNGNVLFTSIFSTGLGVNSLHAFKDILFAQRSQQLGFFFVPIGNALTDSQQTFTSSNRLFSASWRDRIVFTNAIDATMLYYPTTNQPTRSNFKRFGIDPPSKGLAGGWITETSNSGNSDAGANYYMVTLYDQDTNSESPCGGALPSLNGIYELSPNGTVSAPAVAAPSSFGGGKTVTIAHANLITFLQAAQTASPRATHFIIYKCIASQVSSAGKFTGNFFRVPNTNNNGNVINKISDFIAAAADFLDNTAYASLPAIPPPTNNSPPPTPARLQSSFAAAAIQWTQPTNWQTTDQSGFRHIRFFRDQMFGVGAHSPGFYVNTNVTTGIDYTQAITGTVANFKDLLHGSEVFQPDYWPYVWEIGVGDGQETIGLGVLGDIALLIFKQGSAYYLAGSSPDSFVVRIMDLQKGCAHQGTIQETPIGVITLDRSGFVLWDKIGQGTPISNDVFDVIQTIDFTQAASFYSCYDAVKNVYKCSVVIQGSGYSTPTYTFILDLTTSEWSYEQGTEGASRINFSVNQNNYSAYTGNVINVGKVYDFVGSATNGNILDYGSNQNVTNQGAPIVGVWTSGTINFGEDQHKKQMTWIYLRAKSETTFTVLIEVIPDYDESRKYTVMGLLDGGGNPIPGWSPVSSQSLWYSSSISTDGSLIWDDGSGTVGGDWASAGQGRSVSKIPVKCIGYNFQIRITHQDTSAANYAFAIESISAEAKALGR